MDFIKLPLLKSGQTLRDAIYSMKHEDARAVVVDFGNKEYRVFLNHAILEAYTAGEELLASIDESHRPTTAMVIPGNIFQWEVFGQPSIKELFSKVEFGEAELAVSPGTPGSALVLTRSELFVTEIRQASKVCICTHTSTHIASSPPTLDGDPCFCGYGHYECF